MNIKHVTIHQLAKPSSSTDTEIRLRDQELELDQALEDALTVLKQRYLSQSSKRYGNFPQQSTIATQFNRFLEESLSFNQLCQQLTESAKKLLDETDAVFDLNLIFAEEQLLEDRIFYLFCVEESAALSVDQTLQLESTRHLDLHKVSATVRIQMSQWQAGHHRNSLSLQSARGFPGLPELLEQMFEFSDVTNTREETGELMQVVSRYAEQLPEEQRFEVKNQVVDYCLDRSAQGDSVKLKELSAELNQSSPQAFEQFVSNAAPELPSELQPDRAPLKRLVRFSGRGHGISLTFSADLLGGAVVYDPESGELIIKKIPKGILSQLKIEE